MNASINAVFLSYASQDVAAARRIDEALRAAGVVVWFDESELRGGDAWDASIRKKIKECALFVPVISANTESRSEGYFRLEWKLAVDRSHLMADDQPFLLPVVIDDTSEVSARVPDRFRERQWSRLPAGENADVFAEHARSLLGSSEAVPATIAPSAVRAKAAAIAGKSRFFKGRRRARRRDRGADRSGSFADGCQGSGVGCGATVHADRNDGTPGAES